MLVIIDFVKKYKSIFFLQNYNNYIKVVSKDNWIKIDK